MNSVIKSFKEIFSNISLSYLVKSYIIAIAFVWLYFQIKSSPSERMYFVACGLLFPFAKLAWDSTISFFFNGPVVIVNIVILAMWMMWNIAKWMFLFVAAPIIAPITILVLLVTNIFRSRAS